MGKLSIGRAWDESRPIIARDGGTLALIAAAFAGLPTLLVVLAYPQQGMSGPVLLWTMVIGFVLASISTLAINSLVLAIDRTPGDAIRHALRKLVSFLTASLLFLVPLGAILVGSVLGTGNEVIFDPDFDPVRDADKVSGGGLWITFISLLAILFFSTRFAVVSQIAMAEGKSPPDMLKRSWRLTKGHFWRIFAVFFLLQVGASIVSRVVELIAGLIAILVSDPAEPWSVGALIVGVAVVVVAIFFAVITSTFMSRIYAQLAAEPVASVPPTV